jgi:predicted lactoylglutathione lyase
MIDHFEIKVVKFEHSKKFYEAVLEPLGIELKWSDDSAAGFGVVGSKKVAFLLEKFHSSCPVHVAFTAIAESSVQSFYQAGLEAGGECNGQPGLREHYAPNYYAAFLFDPDGNNVEAVVYL